MSHYKIVNQTNELPKRHPNYNSDLEIKYSNNLSNHVYSLKAGEEVIIQCSNLPVNIRIYRAKGFINVIPIDVNQNKTKTKTDEITEIKEKKTVKSKKSSTPKK